MSTKTEGKPCVPVAGAIRLRVRYCECDPMGVVHHGSYVPWLEMGRTELLRDAGLSYAQLEADGVFLVVVKMDVSYKSSGRYDDLVEVRTRVVESGRVKLRHEYEVWCVERSAGTTAGGKTGEGGVGGGRLLVTGSTLLACVDGEGRPRMMPGWQVDLKPAQGKKKG